MAGYSGTPLPKKLGISEGSRIALVNAPDGFEEELTPLPPDVAFLQRVVAPVNVILFFVSNRADLEKRFGTLAKTLAANGGLWIAWPKKASGVATDVTESIVRDVGLAHGLVDNKVCAVDEVWSGLRFVVPVALRKDWPR